MIERRSPSLRLGVRVYSLLGRLMPRDYREAYLAESVADLRAMLDESARLRDESVLGTALRACTDLAWRILVEWWAVLRPAPFLGGDGPRNGGLETGERMANVIRELRLAVRSLAKRPGFAAVATTTLALGIGANVAIFSVVNAILIRPLPYPDSEDVVAVRHHAPGLNLPELHNSAGTINFYWQNADQFAALAAYGVGSANLTGSDQPARIEVLNASPEIFDVLRVQPLMGRPFGNADAGEESSPVALLMYDAWRARFGGDPSIVGRALELDGVVTEIIGVMPDGFAFPDDDPEVLTALYVDPDGAFGEFGTRVVARLADGISLEAGIARTKDMQARIPEFFPEIEPEFLEAAAWDVSVDRLRDRIVADVESALWIILGTVGFLLLIACANVTNLFLVRAEFRQKEMAVRAAMGAGKRAVAASFLSESLVLGAAGGVLGALLAWAGVEALVSASASRLPRLSEVSVDAASLGLALALSLAAGLFFGAIPMTRYAGRRFAQVLRDGGRGTTVGRERHRARNMLVSAQLALGLVLLVGSGLMLRSFAELRAVDIGIEAEGVLTMGLSRDQGEDPMVSARFYQDVADRVAALPGVEQVGITTHIPLASGRANGGSFDIESAPRPEEELPPVAMYRAVGPGYFTSMRMPLLSGRDMTRRDWEEGAQVIWVNESFENEFLGGDAIGERIRFGEDNSWVEIVGVVGDVREFGFEEDAIRPNAYPPLVVEGFAALDLQSAFLTIKMLDGQDPSAVAPGAQAAVRALDARVPITATRTMTELVDEAMASTSFTMVLLGIATSMALFLGAIGLAGVISYVVSQRTREIGVRVALGAHASDVSGMILRQSMLVTAGGTILGLSGAFGLTRLMEALLYEVSATDPVTFVTAPILLVLVSLLATWLPVRRAARVDPMEALRAE